jgi:hypothetical protein
MVLFYMGELSHAEIASLMGRSRDDVRQLKHRALTTLEHQLQAAGYPAPRETRRQRNAMWILPRPLVVLRCRRFALGQPVGTTHAR